MANIEFNHDSTRPGEWLDRFVKLQLKDLNGEPLSHEEKLFLAKVEFAARAVPGVLEEALLNIGCEDVAKVKDKPLSHYGLATNRKTGTYGYRVAAATAPLENWLYASVQQVIEDRQKVLCHQLESQSLEILDIHADEGLVSPRYLEGYTFIIERRKLAPQTVSRYGGIFIAIEDLKRMDLNYDAVTKTIRLYEK